MRWSSMLQGGKKPSILTLNANVNIVLLTSLGLSTGVIGLREGVEGLEVLDVRGHMID
jgi:hypothetical protein